MDRKKIIILALIFGSVWLWGKAAVALKAPHNASRTIKCSNCHYPTSKFRTLTSFDTMCISANGCHRAFATGTTAASKRKISTNDVSNRFGHLPSNPTSKQSSHGWSLPNQNYTAGATNWGVAQPFSILTKKVYCSRCHIAHGETSNPKFLRAPKAGDAICLQCHTLRRITSVRGPKPAGKQYSHPIEVNYSAIFSNKTSWFFRNPTSFYAEPSAKMRLYTAVDTAGAVIARKSVICSSCHGPLHSADSNPYTFDNISAYSRTGNYSTSAGNLLRTYPITVSNNMCLSCHKVKTHKTYMCGDCHEPHKKSDDNNIYMIKRRIAAPYGNHSVFFVSTSQMALRYGIYSMPYKARSTAICQVCHSAKTHHRSYSTTAADRAHNYTRNCTACHPHNASLGAFAQEGGCETCHGAPPSDTYGRHSKHVGAASYTWSNGNLSDGRTPTSYGFSCGRCHNPWSPYTGDSNRHRKSKGVVNDDSVVANYTADMGFKKKGILPNNTTGSYTYGTTQGYDPGFFGGGSSWRYPSNTGGTCTNLYCHGQFYNGYTGNNPLWMNASNVQTCGKCHGATAANPPGTMVSGGTNYGAHPRHVGNAAQQYGSAASPQFRCNACHFKTSLFNRNTSLGDLTNHVDGRVNVFFSYTFSTAATQYGGYNNYSSRRPSTTKPAYITCKLTYCHSDATRFNNYSVSNHQGVWQFPNWSSSKNFTTTLVDGGRTRKMRCTRCHGSTYGGITAGMPAYNSRADKGNSHVKHVVNNGFMCNVCHNATVNSDNKSIADTTKHVNRVYNVDISTRYGGTYDASNHTCSNVKCHGGRTTPAWGTDLSNRCQDCHYKSTAEAGTDEGYKDSYAWKSMTSTSSVPRIYSGEWKKSGHGATASYPSSGNSGANKICTACHKASGTVSHQSVLTNNPYRLITSNTNTDVVCKACHGTGSELGKLGMTISNITGIQQHSYTAMGGWGDATWQFRPKCIDCHDPHGDKNRYMIHTYVNYSGSDASGKRTYDLSQASGYMTFSTVGAQMRWSSYVKADYSYLCQRCHNTQSLMNNFNKAAKSGGGFKSDHNAGARCTDCHKHKAGFKGMNCNACHNFPPTLSGKHAFHVATSVSMSYVDYGNDATTKKYAYGCGKCHNSGNHYVGGTGNYTTEVVFDSSNTLPKNSGSYAFGAKSSIDTGASGTDSYTWTSTKGTCKNLYCHGQFFGGYSGNDPNWYNNGTDDPQTCGKCHGAVKNSSNAPNGGAHNKHVTTYGFKCRFCHRDTSGAFDAYTVIDRKKHADGITEIRLYTTESRVGGSARYGSSGSEFINVTTNTNPASAPTYRWCKSTYCHSSGQIQTTPYALPNYTAFWGYTGNQRTPASSKGCSLCHGNKTYSGITAAMPVQASGNSHPKHVVGDKFKCYVCHANVVDANGNWVQQSNHVNKFKNISIIKTYKSGATNYVDGTDTCSNVKCHGGRTTPAWGSGADCRNCHLKSSAEASSDEGFNDNYVWKSMTSTSSVPKIYSSEWQKFGHGKYSTAGTGGRYPSSGNKAAGKTCTACHKASTPTISHSSALTGNTYRLYTAPAHIDDMCKECHTAAGARSSEATTRVKGHTQAELAAGNATWQFTPKCIDCHDPHGDKNRYMIQSYVNYSGSDASGKRTYDLSQASGYMTFSTIGTQMQWSSYVKSTFDGMCQRCHNVQNNMTNFRKNLFTRSHNAGSRCTSCHKHSDGFRGSGCNGCHNFPPTLSGKHSFHVATSVPMIYVDYTNAGTTRKYAYGCGKCHNSGSHYVGGSGNYTTEVQFDSTNRIPKNSGTYAFGARSSIDPGADGAGGYSWNSTKGTCRNLYCHGQFFGGYSGNDPNWYNNGTDDPQTCGKCHGAVKNSSNAPSGGAHNKHVTNYGFKCRFCHRETSGAFDAYTVINRKKHADGITQIRLYTTEFRVGYLARYGNAGSEFINVTTNTNPAAAPNYRFCKSTYCHSSGQIQTTPYALPNYTAFWGYTGNQRTSASSKGCSLCHGNKTYAGITAAMPVQASSNSHPTHVTSNNFKCYVCHANVVDANGNIVSTANHVNKFKNISIIGTYKSGATNYVDGTDRCSNVKCHGSRTTPQWGSGAACTDCHYTASGAATAEDSFAWTNYSGTNFAAAKVYSTEWIKRGHGKTKASGDYPFSNNSGAGKICDNCHRKEVSHNQSNYFRIITANGNSAANPDSLCARCHGTGTQLQTGFGRITGILNHTYVNMSTYGGYKGGANGKAGWNITPKCVDCHDPHGDSNNSMLHAYINMTGSDSYGKPTPTTGQALVTYTAVGGQVSWSSFARSDKNGICQRCHSPEVDFFDKAQYGNPANTHNNGSPCKQCHKHKKGFAPSGCDSCHGDSARNMGRANNGPPKGPSGWSDSLTNRSSLHQPHAYNPRSRAGFGNKTGFDCQRCHDDALPAGNHNSSKNRADMNNMTSTSGYGGYNSQSKIAFGNDTTKNPADDTCWNTKCHTPRSYTRTWKKPVDCDDCHGYRKGNGAAQRVFNLQTTGKHKIHIRYTGVATPPAGWGRNYNFACKNCHYDWQTNNNYSTHYNGLVNITGNGPINTRGDFYGRGRSFKGFTSWNEGSTTCSNTYCHGNFADGNGLNGTPNWKSGTVNCASCHRSALVDETSMPERHPKHAATTKAGYSFACVRCHSRTTGNITTLLLTYSSHVNGRDDINFENSGGINNSNGTYNLSLRKCYNIYCHSKGTKTNGSYTNRSGLQTYTANWSYGPVSYKLGTGVRAKCNFCHGNKVYTASTSAMPNYSTQTNKPNTHRLHVISYGFTCRRCHLTVTVNNSSIDASGGRTLHVNGSYQLRFDPAYANNTGLYQYVAAGSRCKNTYCHSKGADLSRPFNTRTSLSNFTAIWGDNLASYKRATGQKAKCNYCHGNRAFTASTSAMPNYSTQTGKANSHYKHVVSNGLVCNVCHYGVARNNTSISDRSRHANGFYNISIAPSYASGAGKRYSSVWNTTGGYCMRITCHGSGKPKWGSTLGCRSCHVTTASNDVNNYANWSGFKGTAARVYSTDWQNRGHGGKGTDCTNCHKSTVAHGASSNPYRLYTSDPDKLCGNCHGTGTNLSRWQTTQGTMSGILTHSKVNTSGNAAWNQFTSTPSRGAKCVDCHDPHGDRNKKMIHALINFTGSDKYGRPAAPPSWNTVNGNLAGLMTFSSVPGSATNINWSSFVNAGKTGICQRCHTQSTGDANMANFSKDLFTNHNNGQKCTNCHSHKTGFKGGESDGGINCITCHQDLYNKMRDKTIGYHHVMRNTSAAYKNQTMFGGNDKNSTNRRCLMCHVDHDIFRPDLNPNGRRAKNLRLSASKQGNRTGINTDFWPAKRKNAVRTGGDSGTGNYSSTRPVSGPNGYNGVCISCHKNSQQKNTSLQMDNGTNRTMYFPLSMYTSSSHNFQILSGMMVYGTGGRSSFRANCVKCHRSDFIDKGSAQTGRYKIGLHDNNSQSLLNMSGTPTKPKIETLCYRCHDTAARTAGGPGGQYDYYSSVKMNSSAKMIKTAIEAKNSGHPVDDPDMEGLHKVDEYDDAPALVGANTNPATFWNFSTTRHNECVDCHNTHGGNASIQRRIGGPYFGKNAGYGDTGFANRSAGNKVAGAQSGAWGVQLRYTGTTTATRGQSPRFTKVVQVRYQYELCTKCHSSYAYGANPRGLPSGLPDETTTMTGNTPYETLTPDAPQADIAKMINPNNYGYHPIFQKGRNQPPKSLNSANWPAAKSNWMYYDRFFNKTAFIAVSGLSWTFVPPFSQHSLLACSDCHQSDNTGKAVAKLSWSTGTLTTVGTWTVAPTGANIAALDNNLAVTTSACTNCDVYVPVKYPAASMPYPTNQPTDLLPVAYGSSTASTTNQRNGTTLGIYSGATNTVLGTAKTNVVTPYNKTNRMEGNLLASTRTWSQIDSGTKKARYLVDTTNGGIVKLDYVGIEALYRTTSEVRGPHGSLQKWILMDVDPDIWIDVDQNGTLVAAERINRQATITSIAGRRIMCYNCHRADVYGKIGDADGAAAYDQYSRINHPPEGGGRADNPSYNVWGIFCMNCHAGGNNGEIHGSFANSTTDASWGGTRTNLQRPRGVRLMNGAIMNWNPVTSTCYNPTNRTAYASGGCTSHTTGGSSTGITHYAYTTW